MLYGSGSLVDRRKFELQTTVRPDSVETELGSGGDEGGGDGSPGGGGDDGAESGECLLRLNGGFFVD